ncbi:aminopeptidase N [Formosa sp. Hel1_31_208]|uniref:M1 family metallopeptidase n=1 Tax=Formosa sp. Hel1_31_208 TaxID=1798225 RepID=UPI00087A8FF9|nr:M1 family metallopeptidase [Formosa sp. Hel1_31_208]SDS20344.1 aminopeptidase N [Formosa sp. Hel1_31_208]
MKSLIQIVFVFIFSGTIAAQQTDYVDFKRAAADVYVDSQHKEVRGLVTYTFDVLKPVDSIVIDIQAINCDRVTLNDTELILTADTFNGVIRKRFSPSKDNALEISYHVKPKKALYFVGDQIWTQGQGKYTSNWLPSLDNVNDKIEFDLSITYENGYDVLANGKLVNKEFEDGFTTWHYDMKAPMSSYLVALVVGKYNKKIATSKSGIPLEFYFYPEDSLKVEPTYRYTKRMFDFMEEEIGFPFPWQNYKQAPVKDFLYSGMENTSLTVFSDSFVVDSTGYNDRSYITVNAHELAHQWFGNLVTATSGEHHWLQEGFATYYALLAEREIFGSDHYYWQLFKNAQELIAQNSAGQSTSLLNPKSSSTTFYKKGAWALHILRERVGDSAFKTAVVTYLEKHQFANVDTSDFIKEVEMASGHDLTDYVNTWLMASNFPEDAVVRFLKQSSFMQDYFMLDCEVFTSECNEYLLSNISDKAKVKVISQIKDKVNASAFQNSLEVRQAIANYATQIPLEIKLQYESLLEDPSYITKELALYNLWVNFPKERAKYLQQTKDIIGFNDYNVRLLWLGLHLNTPEYQSKKKIEVLNELISYSLPNQHFELRMNAFKYLKLIGGFEIESVRSLIQATKHHNWRFSKFSKSVLEELEQNVKYKILIGKLKNQL